MSISKRLKEERNRLGLTQTEMGSLGGVKKVAQINYEKGERNPDASYLAGVAQAGVDVLYILTGSRMSDGNSCTHANVNLLKEINLLLSRVIENLEKGKG